MQNSRPLRSLSITISAVSAALLLAVLASQGVQKRRLSTRCSVLLVLLKAKSALALLVKIRRA